MNMVGFMVGLKMVGFLIRNEYLDMVMTHWVTAVNLEQNLVVRNQVTEGSLYHHITQVPSPNCPIRLEGDVVHRNQNRSGRSKKPL